MEEVYYTTGGKLTAEKRRIAKTVYNYTAEEANSDYKKFMEVEDKDITPFSQIGLKFLNYYFGAYRLDTTTKKKVSFYEFYKNPELRNKQYVKNLMEHGKSNLIQAFNLYWGTVAQFRPTQAYLLYKQLKPKTVMDFSAGWGGRLLGAVKYGCDYIGFDTNTELRKPYKEVLNYIKPTQDVKIIFKDSSKVDYSKYTYDTVFTSPPYFTTEMYENMPEYESYDNWVKNFLEPVVSNSYKFLQPNGKFCLNIPDKIYESVKTILGRKADWKIPLIIGKRQKGHPYKEYIYVWEKQDSVRGGRIKRILEETNNNRDMCKFLHRLDTDDETLDRIEKFLKIGGAVDVDIVKQEDIPKIDVKPLPSPVSPVVETKPMTISTIPQPKGIWLFFHKGDLAGLSQIGGASKATKFFRKVGRKLKEVAKETEQGVKKAVKEVKKVERIFKPITRTDIPLASIKSGEPVAPYITVGKEKRSDGEYDVVTISCYYTENVAIGVGWELRPRDSKLGYHPHDVEFVSIYYQNDTPIKVFFSQHSIGKGEGVWKNYSECEIRDGYLCVYVSRNSHSNFPTAGTQVRIAGFANDVREVDGPNKQFKFTDMIPSYDWNSGTGIKLYKGLRPPPPDKSMSQRERVLRI